MKTYTPDKFVLIDYGVEYDKERYAVLGGWYGGFAGSNSWKRSSPIEKAKIVNDKEIIITTHSGSKYILYKGCVGVTMLTQSIIAQAKLDAIAAWNEIIEALKENGND